MTTATGAGGPRRGLFLPSRDDDDDYDDIIKSKIVGHLENCAGLEKVKERLRKQKSHSCDICFHRIKGQPALLGNDQVFLLVCDPCFEREHAYRQKLFKKSFEQEVEEGVL